jgi:hypothetical protein
MSKPSKRPNREERKVHKKILSRASSLAGTTEKRWLLSGVNRRFQYDQCLLKWFGRLIPS